MTAFEPKLYNPAGQPEDWLIEHFVVRTKVFERIFEDILTGAMQHPEQHYLIQGQRGMGKTTLLLRLKYEIERTKELNWLVPVFFNEESYDLISLSNLWEKLLKYFDGILQDGGGYYKATDKFIGSDEYEEQCFRLVLNILHQHKKKLVVLFDNFGELFLDNLDDKDSHRFREILMTCNDMRIIAASAVVLESHNDYSEPFFDFFKVINLDGLSKDETMELIKKMDEKSALKIDIEANKARIETLAILTGGVIRTIIMLYEILLTDSDGSALKDLEGILDKVTPLYKHRMDDLKPQQRRIMDVIAKNWDAITVKDISASIREKGKPVPGKIISAQLQELEKNNLVEKIKTSTKNNLYIVKERFFNIWYLMRHGDKTSQCRVKWLTRFLETWYGAEHNGMDAFIQEYIKKLQSGMFINASAITMTNALLSSPKTSGINQALLLEVTAEVIPEGEVKHLPKIDQNLFNYALDCYIKKNYFDSIRTIESMALKNRNAIDLLALSYFLSGDKMKAIELIEKSNAKNPYLYYILGVSYFRSDPNKSEFNLKKALLPGADVELSNKIRETLLRLYLAHSKKKTEAYELARELFMSNENKIRQIAIAAAYFWNNQFKEAEGILLNNDSYFDIGQETVQATLLILLSKRQYHLTLRVFNETTVNLKDKQKPIYYALMYLLKDEYPDEYIKMGKELEEPVKEVLRTVEQYSIDYA